MNKTQLIDALSTRYEGNRKQAQQALESVLDVITREVARGEKVAITGFGSFEKRVREARWVRNPRTGERIKAKKTAIPKFTAGADLKNVVSGAKKLPKLPKASDVAKKATAPARQAASAAATTGAAVAKKATGGSRSTAKKSTATKSTATKSTASKSAAKKSSPSKSTASTSTAKKSSPAKSTASKSTASKSTAGKAPAKKSSTASKSTSKRTAAKKS